MESIRDRNSPTMGRVTGATALGMFVLFLASLLLGPGTMIHSDPNAQQAITYAAQHHQLIWIQGFLDGLLNTVFAVLAVLLIGLTGSGGILARISYVSVAAAAALQWAHAGMLYALADLAHRGGADAGVLALFSLGETMDHTDGVPVVIALACIGMLMLRSRAVPAPLAWLTLLVSGIHVISSLSTVAGAQIGPVAVGSAVIWSLATGTTLLVKPVWGPRPMSMHATANA